MGGGAAGWRQTLREGAEALGLSLPPDTLGRLERYVGMVARWGRAVNLTGARDEDGVVREHLLDSLGLVAVGTRRGWFEGGRLVDVGAGAGFPGLVVAALRPELEVFLVEGRERRAVFLEEAVRALGVRRVAVIWGRAEREGRRRLAAACDVGTARAVGPLARVVGLVMPLLRVGGLLLAQKGPGWRAELPAAAAALAAHGGVLAGVEAYLVPGSGRERFVVVAQRAREVN